MIKILIRQIIINKYKCLKDVFLSNQKKVYRLINLYLLQDFKHYLAYNKKLKVHNL